MTDLYRQLYGILNAEHSSIKMPADGVSVLYPMAGARFEGQSIKLMLIGRAANGWDEGYNGKISEEAFVRRAVDALNSREGFSWIHGNSEKNQKGYNIRRSAFWRTARGVFARLNALTEAQLPCDWYEGVVWHNLYCVVPQTSGNPSAALAHAQLELCRQLLIKQIAFYQPTHLLFVTGWDGWFSKFADCFPDVGRAGADGFVAGSGTDGHRLAVVTARPECKPERDYVETVSGAFFELARK